MQSLLSIIEVSTSAYGHFNDTHLHMVDADSAQLCILNAVAQCYLFNFKPAFFTAELYTLPTHA